MEDQTTSAPAVQERQRAAVLLLAALLKEPLPPASWTLFQWGELNGQLSRGEEGRRELAEWAAYLHAPMAEERGNDGALRGKVSVRGDVLCVLWAEIEPPSARRAAS
jgi:hypothetical protein